LFDNVRADFQALTPKQTRVLAKLLTVAVHPGFHSVLLYRISRWFYLHRIRAVSILVNYCCSMLTGAQISHAAEIGKGLVIYHPHGIVVGRTAVLGEYCVLVHGNVIGQRLGNGDRPRIGDRFYAATGAKILGRVHIGNDVRVGANAVVLDSLPDGVTVAGNPARIVRIPEAANDAAAGRVPERGGAAVLPRVLAALARSVETLSAGAIGRDTVLLGEGVGVDSLDVLRIVSEIEEEFDVTLDESRLDPARMRTVGTLAAMIEELISHGQPRDFRRAG
jgi:serine acetyltransferase/acyl carrier protein